MKTTNFFPENVKKPYNSSRAADSHKTGNRHYDGTKSMADKVRRHDDIEIGSRV